LLSRELGDVVAFWVLQKAGFWRIVRPFLIQHVSGDEIRNICCLLTPHQIRQRTCLLPGEDELYYKERILNEDQLGAVHRWDYLALRIQKSGDRFEAYPSLIDVVTHEPRGLGGAQRGLYRKNRDDLDNMKESGFRVYTLEIVLCDNWRFEARIEEI